MEGPAGDMKVEEGGGLASHPDGSSVNNSNCSKQGRSSATEDVLPSKGHRNLFDTKASKGESQEHESEGKEVDEGGEVALGLPRFLSHLVKVGKYVPVTSTKSGEILVEDEDFMVDAPSLVTPLLIKQPHQFLTHNGTTPDEKQEEKRLPLFGKGGKYQAEYFASTVGQFLIGIGLSQALQVYSRDLLRSKEREMRKAGGRTQDTSEEYSKLSGEHQQAKIANAPFTFKLKLCRVCDFKTESGLVLDGHLLTPHLTTRRELQCSFCSFATRDAKAIVFHMKAIHNRLPTMEPAPHFYQCPFCAFETNVKSKANVHVNRCQKHFISSVNQVFQDRFELPAVTPRPFTIKDVISYKKYHMESGFNTTVSAKGTQGRPYVVLNQNGSHALAGSRGPGYQQLSSVGPAIQSRGRGHSKLTFIQPSPLSNRLYQIGSKPEVVSLLGANPQLTATLAGAPLPSSSNNTRSALRAAAASSAQLQVSSGQRPRTSSAHDSAAFVICEICDGYIKDLEQLRTHMQWIHKVKIHPKMLASRPPLNCQKCQWRFFTDQGLERHLLGAHGLVTSNMQYLANCGQDSGRCTVCGRIYASKLVAHMSQVHRVMLKPAHLSYKCTVCTETFTLYRLFEAHVYSMHSGSAKRASSAAALDGRPTKRPAVDPHSAPLGVSKAEIVYAKAKHEPELKDVASMPVVLAPATPISRTGVKEEPASVDMAPVVPAEPAEPLLSSRCMTCEADVGDLAEHVKEQHIRQCRVRMCHIEKCDRCLCSFRGMLVLHTSDIGEEDSSDDEAEEDEVENNERERDVAQPVPLNIGESHSSAEDIAEFSLRKHEDCERKKDDSEEGTVKPGLVNFDGPDCDKITAAPNSNEDVDGEKNEVKNDALLPNSMDLDVPYPAKHIGGLNSEKKGIGGQCEKDEGEEDVAQQEPMDLCGALSTKDTGGQNSEKKEVDDLCEKDEGEEDAVQPEPMELCGALNTKDTGGQTSEKKEVDDLCEKDEGEEDAVQLEPMGLDGAHNAKDIIKLDSEKEDKRGRPV